MSGGEKYLWTVADHDAEERAELNRYGIPMTAAKMEVTIGIAAVKKTSGQIGGRQTETVHFFESETYHE